MALSYAQGTLEWTTGAVSTTFTVSGLSFQPKALRFWTMGLNSATDATSDVVDWEVTVGFATSTSDRRCVLSHSEESAGSAACATGYFNDCVLALTDGGALAEGKLDLSAINSDGFTLIVDEVAVRAQRVFWEAWGGSDITNAATGEISEPAATGTQDYTTAGFQPDVVLFAGAKQLTANGRTAIDSGVSVGAADASANQWVFTANSDDGSATMDTDRSSAADSCIATITEGGGLPNALAGLTTMLSTGFRLNWTARATTNRKSIYLAIKGGQWRVGTYSISPGTVGNTASVSGLPFQPVGCLQATAMNGAAGNASNAFLGMGRFASTTDRSGASVWDADAVGTSAIQSAIDYDSVIRYPSITSSGAIDVNAVNSDGFQMIVDAAEALLGGFIGYVAFGSVAAAEPAVPWPYRMPFTRKRLVREQKKTWLN